MSAVSQPRFRPASRDDVPAVLALLAAGFDAYRRFGPEGWTPPEQGRGAAMSTEYLLTHGETWFVVACDERGHAGQCGYYPAHAQPMMRGAPVLGLAHLWQLVVREDLWGTGLAGELHDRALTSMVERGFTRARLNTAAAHARARAFYERRGWRVDGPSPDRLGSPGLELVRYGLELPAPGRDASSTRPDGPLPSRA